MNILILFSLLAFTTNEVSPKCSCIPQTVDESINSAKVIFKGEVIKIDTLITIDTATINEPDGSKTTHYFQEEMIKVSFKVTQNIKNTEGQKFISVFTTYQCCTCGFPFRLNANYVVYTYSYTTRLASENRITNDQTELKRIAQRPIEIFATSSCSRTTSACDSEIKVINSFLKSQTNSR